MLEAPEIEPHHHKTGHTRLDLIMGALAVFLSGTSVFIAVRHGETMERLVAANSWPNLSYGTSNETDDLAKPEISFELKNTGVGPARIDSFELFYKNVPMAHTTDLLVACCGHGKYNFSESIVVGEVLPARESIKFLVWDPARNDPEKMLTLDHERLAVRVRACYCSVFDECWVLDSTQRRPSRVGVCTPSQPQQFTP